jgi:hypothetical protein
MLVLPLQQRADATPSAEKGQKKNISYFFNHLFRPLIRGGY